MTAPVFENGATLVKSILPPRESDSHKGNFGSVILFCGSVGLSGAAVFSSAAAVRSGAGLVRLIVPRSIYSPISAVIPEVMCYPACETESGRMTEKAAEDYRLFLNRSDVMVLGCGLGHDPDTEKTVCSLLNSFKGITVLDADGINAFEGNPEFLRNKGYILTPHEGELKRLGYSRKENENKTQAALRISSELGCILVYKGAHSVVASPDGRYYVNSTGNPGMSKGGSGDVLSGTIAGIAAQCKDAFLSACAGVYLHGLAGDLAAKNKGQIGMTPSDTIESLPFAFKETLGY